MGIAQLWLDRKRSERKQMRIVIDGLALQLLDQMVRVPETLPLSLVASHPSNPFKQWAARDQTAARQVRHIQAWITQKVFTKHETIIGKYNIPEKYEGDLPANYVQRMKEIVKYYEPLGMLAGFSNNYLSLVDALDGKTSNQDEGAINDLLNYKDNEEKK